MSKIEKVTLDNGLDIYFYLDKKRHSVFFQHITKFGGVTKDFISNGKTYHIQDGIAHILEHYIVEENKYGNFLKLLGEAQMSTNASTHLDMTRFYFSAVENVEFKPELMDKYGIPITLVAGGRDKKSPPEELRKKYNILKSGKNGHLWKFVVFKDSKHSFIDQYGDWRAIIRLIQSQKKYVKKK